MLVCGVAYAEPEEELIAQTPPQAAAPASDAEALARLQKMKSSIPSAQPATTKSVPSAQAATPKSTSALAATPKSTERGTPDQIRKRGADWLAQCVKDWDAETHMTKKDWQKVCRRVAADRINGLIKQAKK
jgi:predicted component of type VI protein secretion system